MTLGGTPAASACSTVRPSSPLRTWSLDRVSARVAPNSSDIDRRNIVIRIAQSLTGRPPSTVARMELAQAMPSWGPTALTLASIATLVAVLVVLIVQWRRNGRR